MKPSILLMGAALVTLATSGCTTVTRGSHEAFTVNSVPDGADVTIVSSKKKISDMHCVTPCTLQVKRKHNLEVTVSKEGYKSVTRHVESDVDTAGAAGMAGNVILGGLIGAGIDAGTGATKHLVPNPLEVTLEAEDTAPAVTLEPPASPDEAAPAEAPTAQAPAADTPAEDGAASGDGV